MKLKDEAYDSLDKGNYKKAIQILNELKTKDCNVNLCQIIGGLYIDIGADTENLEFINKGIEYFEKLSKLNLNNNYYNLANGYSEKIKLTKQSNFDLEKITLFDVKKYYKKALENGYTIPNCYINLANTLDQLGRFIEAIEIYDNILKKEPENSMALINKGITLYKYNRITKFQVPLIKDSYNCFKKVLEIPKISLKEETISREYIKEIEKIIPKQELKKEDKLQINLKKENNFENYLTNFCLKNKLYLNLCNHCQRCENSIGDSLIINNMISKITKNIEEDSYLIISSYLNQIKMDFISARFLIALSEYENINLDFIDNVSFIVNTLQYEDNSIRTELLKNAFKNLFDILDKISIFINEYLNLGINKKNIDFRSIWFNKGKYKNGLNKNITCSKNNGISALFDIYRSFEENEEYHYLRKMRHTLTHRFLKITYFNINNENQTREELLKNTLLLSNIVKNSIIYLIVLVTENENKKREELKEEFL